MKLIDIANRYYLIILTLIFLGGSFTAYQIMKSIINREFNEKLLAEKEQLIFELNTFDNLQESYSLNIGDKIDLTEVSSDPNIDQSLRDTIMYDLYERKELPFRILTFSGRFNNKYYIVNITKSLLPNQDLIKGISEIMIGLVLILAIALGLLNRFIFKKLWAPFYEILSQLREFNIVKPEPLVIKNQHVSEFIELKKVLDIMIHKNIRDFKNLKDYTENTTHEIQTPLAIIKNKAELLLQEPLSEQQMADVATIYEATRRLSRLKEGLSTITRIDNGQFVENQTVKVKEFLDRKIESFTELLELKNITVKVHSYHDTYLRMNQDLAYILFTNLLSNAIKHNMNRGTIDIFLMEEKLVIKNTGEPPKIPTDELFDRFKKSGNSSDSTGLGLSLVKKIADYYQMGISYQYMDKNHVITLIY